MIDSARLAELGRIFLHNSPVPATVHFQALNDYEKLRRRVLFEIWQPEQQQIEFASRICRQCGFMAYAPRPTDDDIRDKYLFLNKIESLPQISATTKPPLIEFLEQRRAQRVYDLLRPELADGKLEVLDYGGADGKMLRPFLEQGDDCALVDYDDRQIAGVTKIANDLSDMPPGKTFDAVICNHVLEHVAEPLPLVGGLRDCLKSRGVVYAEVPHQILAGIRLGADPVTHINFYSPRSFRLLFERAGFHVLRDHVQVGNYGRARLQVICLVAQKQDGVDHEVTTNSIASPQEIHRLLHPGRLRLMGHFINIHLLPRLENLLLNLSGRAK